MNSQQVVTKVRVNSAFKQLMSLHWWMATCYLILFIGGWFMSQLSREAPFRDSLYDFHKSIGVLTMALLTLRIFTLLRVWWRKYAKRLPKFTPAWIKNFLLHTTLYIFMWAVPVAGFLLSNSFKSNNVKFFGIVLPDIFPQSQAMVAVGRNMHFWFGYTFLALILLHTLIQWKVVKANWRRFTKFLQARFRKQTAS